MTDRHALAFGLSRRQALVGVSAAAFAAGMGTPLASASAAIVPGSFGDDLTDMTGHVPAYAAAIGFGRPSTVSALAFADPHDLVFA